MMQYVLLLFVICREFNFVYDYVLFSTKMSSTINNYKLYRLVINFKRYLTVKLYLFQIKYYIL